MVDVEVATVIPVDADAVVDGRPKFKLLPPANCSLPPLEINPLPTVEPWLWVGSVTVEVEVEVAVWV